jgi:hypothetical protein
MTTARKQAKAKRRARRVRREFNLVRNNFSRKRSQQDKTKTNARFFRYALLDAVRAKKGNEYD